MSNVSDSGNGNVVDMTIEVLKDIREELRGVNQRIDGLSQRVDGLNERVDGLNERVDGLNERVDLLNERVETGFAAVNGRLDSVLKIVGTHHLQLETRVTRIEDHLGLKTG